MATPISEIKLKSTLYPVPDPNVKLGPWERGRCGKEFQTWIIFSSQQATTMGKALPLVAAYHCNLIAIFQ